MVKEILSAGKLIIYNNLQLTYSFINCKCRIFLMFFKCKPLSFKFSLQVTKELQQCIFILIISKTNMKHVNITLTDI